MTFARARRFGEIGMAFLFAISTALQANDPDPLPWAALYTSAMVVCVFADDTAKATWARAIPLSLLLMALVWAGTLVPGVLREAELADLVRTMKHENHAEEARELGGLLIVAVTMGWIATRPRPAEGPSELLEPSDPL